MNKNNILTHFRNPYEDAVNRAIRKRKHIMDSPEAIENNKSNAGVIYILTNPAMPGLVKIGKTSNAAEVRMDSLYTTGVAVPFECAKAVEVEDIHKVEKALHIAFGPQRINPKREFFKIDEIQALVLLELLSSKNVTPSVEADNQNIDEESRVARKSPLLRRPNLNFEEMGIPVGSILHAINSDETAEVIGARKVRFKGVEMSLTAATKQMLNTDQAPMTRFQWQYNGRPLSQIYEDTYGEGG